MVMLLYFAYAVLVDCDQSSLSTVFQDMNANFSSFAVDGSGVLVACRIYCSQFMKLAT